jgi:hypothetical protein
MSYEPDLLSGASQIAALMAQQSGPGFSKDPGDYQPAKVKLSGAAFNPNDPGYRPELDPLGFLIGQRPIGAAGAPVIVLGWLSGCQEKDRVVIDGRAATRLHAIWKRQPEITVVRGKGGGLRTGRGGWVTGEFDEVFMLVGGELCVLSLYDMHYVVAALNRSALMLGVNAMHEVKWQLTKKMSDEEYSRAEPIFTPLGVAEEASGPSEAEIAQAKKLNALIGQLSYANPDTPNSTPMGEPPAPPPPPDSPDDYGAERDDLPNYLK